MKKALLIFVLAASPALMAGPMHADATTASEKPTGTESDGERIAAAHGPAKHVLSRPQPIRAVGHSRILAAGPRFDNARHPRLLPRDAGGTGARLANETSRPARPAPFNGVTHSYAPALNVRHRGSNPAIIGAPTSTRNKSAATLDGTRMSRKP